METVDQAHTVELGGKSHESTMSAPVTGHSSTLAHRLHQWLTPARLIPAVACAAAIVVVSRYPLFTVTQTSEHAPRAVQRLIQLEQNFGEVWENEAYKCRIVLCNTGKTTVRVSNLAGECDCTKILTDHIELPPDSQRAIDLVVDLTRERPGDGTALRDVGVRVHGQWSEEGGEEHRAIWTIHGQVRRYVVFDPPSLGLGEDVVAGLPGVEHRVFVSAERPLGTLEVASAPAGWSARLS